MCILFSAQAYYTYSKTLYSRYNEKLSTLLNHVTKRIDLDDLYQCVITGEKSEKYPHFLKPAREDTCGVLSLELHFIIFCSVSSASESPPTLSISPY